MSTQVNNKIIKDKMFRNFRAKCTMQLQTFQPTQTAAICKKKEIKSSLMKLGK